MAQKTIDDVRRLISQLEQERICSNGTVIGILFKNTVQKGKNKTFGFTTTAEKLCEQFNQEASTSSVVRQIRNVFASYKHLIKHVNTNWTEIKKFLAGNFLFEPDTSLQPRIRSVTVTTANEFSPEKNPVPSSTGNSVALTPVKTRTDCVKCHSVKKLNFALKKTLVSEKKKTTVARSDTANLKKLYKVRETRQKVKRQGEALDKLKPLLNTKTIQIEYLQKKLNRVLRLNEQLAEENQCLKVQNRKLLKKLQSNEIVTSSLKKELCETKLLVDHLQCVEMEVHEKENSEGEVFQTTEGKQYAPVVRRCIYKQLLCDVPIANCGPLLKDFIKTVLLKDAVRVPSAATCSQMAYELGVMSTLQLADFMMGSKNLCLSWDATSLEGAHINELHVTANDKKCLILDVRHLAGGKTADYVSHIISALAEAAATYARFKGIDQDEVFKALKSSISATLTDRAAVNACVTRQLKDELEAEIVQLNCNVHPLDSIARDVRKALGDLDKSHGVKSECFGNDCVAANVINAVSVLRFKDGVGDPLGFKNFLRQNDLPLGTFVRYVGNRLHILFHLAGVLVTHREKLLAFTKEECTGGKI
ncbi:hypothetical protein ElyMa_004385600 [Elysia marginata]|uniref:Uncharacterized protein n=1 Tax=Elysia marginata TaxID=1093978 RepID=A0AAV4H7T6_9GAST|nr:hypothetical protein ElyMa_004385600 [Elysia marginata]